MVQKSFGAKTVMQQHDYESLKPTLFAFRVTLNFRDCSRDPSVHQTNSMALFRSRRLNQPISVSTGKIERHATLYQQWLLQ